MEGVEPLNLVKPKKRITPTLLTHVPSELQKEDQVLSTKPFSLFEERDPIEEEAESIVRLELANKKVVTEEKLCEDQDSSSSDSESEEISDCDDPDPVDFDPTELNNPEKQHQLLLAFKERNTRQKMERQSRMENLFLEITNGIPAPYITPTKFSKRRKKKECTPVKPASNPQEVNLDVHNLEEALATCTIDPSNLSPSIAILQTRGKKRNHLTPVTEIQQDKASDHNIAKSLLLSPSKLCNIPNISITDPHALITLSQISTAGKPLLDLTKKNDLQSDSQTQDNLPVLSQPNNKVETLPNETIVPSQNNKLGGILRIQGLGLKSCGIYNNYRNLIITIIGLNIDLVISYPNDLGYLLAAMIRLGMFIFPYWSNIPKSKEREEAERAFQEGTIITRFTKCTSNNVLRDQLNRWRSDTPHPKLWFSKRENKNSKFVGPFCEIVKLLTRLTEESLATLSMIPISCHTVGEARSFVVNPHEEVIEAFNVLERIIGNYLSTAPTKIEAKYVSKARPDIEQLQKENSMLSQQVHSLLDFVQSLSERITCLEQKIEGKQRSRHR